MTNKLDNYLNTHATALVLRGQRASLLANNLVNTDTPNFKARDIDFQSTFTKALQANTTASPPTQAVTHSGHIPLSTSSGLTNLGSGATLYRVPAQSSLDGNTVNSDVEKSQFTENAVRYQASLEFLNQRIGGLVRAIRGE